MIYVKDAATSQVIKVEPFHEESELEAVIIECPALVLGPTDLEIRFVARQIALGTGIADLILLDRDMLPTVVEVKLARNGQSKREVVRQLFDYVSSLADLTFDELDHRVGNRLEAVVRDLTSSSEDENEDGFAKARVQCGTNLRAGTVRVVVVVDEDIDDLARIVRYVANHSSIDVRLVQVEKHVSNNGSSIFVPRILVYRLIRPKGWPSRLHYEFTYFRSSGTIGVELHVISDELRAVSERLPKIAEQVKEDLKPLQITFDPKWSSGRGRLRILFIEAPADEVANAMHKFINATQKLITSAL